MKAQLGRYVSKLGTDLTEGLNPIATSVTRRTTRTWTRHATGQLRAGLRPRELRGQRRMRRHRQQQLREEQPERDPLGSGSPGRLRQARRQLGLLDRNPARAAARASRSTGGYYYNNGGYTARRAAAGKRVTDNLLVGPDDYDTVLRQGTARFAAAERRRLRRLRQRQHQAEQFGQVSNLVTRARAVRRIREPQRLLQRRDRRPRSRRASGSAAASIPAARWPATASSSTARRNC